MKTRLTLHQTLIDILGSSNVYYNPPETIKMQFPCIVYSLDYIEPIHANNQPYIDWTTYKIIVVSKIPDHPATRQIMQLPMTRFSTRYVRDGLYHDVVILKQKEKQICQS